MSIAAQPVTEDDGPLSPRWIRTIVLVMMLGFSGLVMPTMLSYRNAPPIPGMVLDHQGDVVFSGADIRNGQAVFLQYGVMANGSIWGHGAYLGPDYAAAALHRMGVLTAQAIALDQYRQPFAELAPARQASVTAETGVTLKTNRYDATSGTLRLTSAQAEYFRQEVSYWRGDWPGVEKYVRVAFRGTNGGLGLMVLMSLFPSGVLQLWDVLEHGYWHARSIDYIGSDRARLVEWLRMPGDVIFIAFGAVPLFIGSIKAYIGLHRKLPAGARAFPGNIVNPVPTPLDKLS